VPAEVEKEEGESERRLFLLQIVQPGLAGLMDGSVSTLAPLFAAAFATRQTWPTFLVGPCGRDRRRDLDVVRRSIVRQRLVDRARRARAHLAVPGALLYRCNHDRRGDRSRRTRGDFVGPQPLHGDATGVGGVSGLVGGLLVFATGIAIGSG